MILHYYYGFCTVMCIVMLIIMLNMEMALRNAMEIQGETQSENYLIFHTDSFVFIMRFSAYDFQANRFTLTLFIH